MSFLYSLFSDKRWCYRKGHRELLDAAKHSRLKWAVDILVGCPAQANDKLAGHL